MSGKCELIYLKSLLLIKLLVNVALTLKCIYECEGKNTELKCQFHCNLILSSLDASYFPIFKKIL